MKFHEKHAVICYATGRTAKICGYMIHGQITAKNIKYIMQKPVLTLLLQNMTCPVLANSVDPDQLTSEEAN